MAKLYLCRREASDTENWFASCTLRPGPAKMSLGQGQRHVQDRGLVSPDKRLFGFTIHPQRVSVCQGLQTFLQI